MSAEDHYLFRHAVVREAAYFLQLPSERAELHAYAFDVLESTLPADEHDSHAFELAQHAAAAEPADACYSARRLDYMLRAVNWARENYRYGQLAEAARDVIAHPEVTPEQRGEAQNALGTAWRIQGRFDEAEQLLGEAVAALPAGNQIVRARVLGSLGAVLLRKHRLGEAAEIMREAAALARETGDLENEARTMANLALVQFEAHDPASEKTLQQARMISQRSQNPTIEALILNHTARVLHHEARFDEATVAYRVAIEAARKAGDRVGEGVATSNLAELLRITDPEESRSYMQRALATANELGDRLLEMNTLGNYGLLLHALQDLPGAHHALQRSVSLAREMGEMRGLSIGLSNLVDLHSQMGDYAAAESAAREALTIARSIGDAGLEASVLCQYGTMLVESERKAEGVAQLREANALALAHGNQLVRLQLRETIQTLVKNGLLDENTIEQPSGDGA